MKQITNTEKYATIRSVPKPICISITTMSGTSCRFAITENIIHRIWNRKKTIKLKNTCLVWCMCCYVTVRVASRFIFETRLRMIIVHDSLLFKETIDDASRHHLSILIFKSFPLSNMSKMTSHTLTYLIISSSSSYRILAHMYTLLFFFWSSHWCLTLENYLNTISKIMPPPLDY